MSEKSSRYGKYNSNTYGTPHHLHPKDWGNARRFVGSELNVYEYRDPDTGIVWHIHAPDFESAQTQATTRGWVQYRKRKSKRK